MSCRKELLQCNNGRSISNTFPTLARAFDGPDWQPCSASDRLHHRAGDGASSGKRTLTRPPIEALLNGGAISLSSGEGQLVQLVPGRECGTCVACCRVLAIKQPDLKKQSGVLCPNCIQGSGCRIYDVRPHVCRSFHCGWRRFGSIPDSWRPDDFGVLVDLAPDMAPEGYPRVGLKFLVYGGQDILLKKEFAEVLGGFVDKRVPVFLAIPGPPGHYPATSFLNEAIGSAVASRDPQAVQHALQSAYQALLARKFTPVDLA